METLGHQAEIDNQQCISWSVEISPCQEACPLGIDVEGYIGAVARGEFAKALEIIREKCLLPSVCGRICHRPCEDVCKRRNIDQSVAIRDIKKFVSDYQLEQISPLPKIKKSKILDKVAVIGSGPSGLCCAGELANKGYPVTIFEALPKAGGMLQVGIPEFRLSKTNLQKEIEIIKKLGVEIRTNTPITKDFNIDSLFEKGYKAVFIAVGAHKSKSLSISGEDAKGVLPGVVFLRELNLGNEVKIGKRVAIIGGGNVAIDAARSVLRANSEATIIYRRSRQEMPAYDESIEAAEAEGVLIIYQAQPTEILNINGRVAGINCVRTLLGRPDASKRKHPESIPNSEFKIDVDMVMPAIGEFPDLSFLGKPSDIQISQWGGIATIDSSLATSRKGVFTGGDAHNGPRTAVEAMAEGRKAADSIHRFLSGEPFLEEKKDLARVCVKGAEKLPSGLFLRNRERPIELPMPSRLSSFQEVNSGYTREQAILEATRCLKCWTCNRCTDDFGCVAIVLGSNNGKRSPHIDRDLCVGCQVCIQVCPFGYIRPVEVNHE